MLSHSLSILVNQLRKHFVDVYDVDESTASVAIGNIAEGLAGGSGGVPRDVLLLSVVNIREEKALKNLPNYVRNDVTLKAKYENPPIYVNITVLMTATHTDYANALLVLSRALRFFQSQHVFTHNSVAPKSITDGEPHNVLDRLSEFKLVIDLYSPSLEEVNQLWGTLGGKQYPFAIYNMRMIDLKYSVVGHESGLITEVVSDFHHKNGDPH